MNGWESLLECLAVIGIVVVALALMIGIQEPADAFKSVGDSGEYGSPHPAAAIGDVCMA